MDRICTALSEAGYDCLLMGRLRKTSIELSEKPYQQVRIPCLFDKGKLFYLEYNFKLFWALLFRRFDALCAIDLDTILPCYVVSELKSKALVYDAHEYFTELEEVITRPFVHKVWSRVEQFCIPRIKYCYTISQGYANLFKEAYTTEFEVIRNVPKRRELEANKTDKPFIIYQGALNVGRGLEESIMAMREIDHIQYRIYGDGPIKEKLKNLITLNGLNEKVKLYGSVTPEKLRSITPQAKFGFTLFSETGRHHKYSMANRFFDYFHAEIPQIAMNFPEYKSFNEKHHVALLIDELSEEEISGAIKELLNDVSLYNQLKHNCTYAREVCNWQEESKKLVELYSNVLK